MEKLDARHSQGLTCSKLYTFSCICSSHLLATTAKIVRKANKQVNRRQLNEGNCKLYHVIEKHHRILKEENLNCAS